MHTVGGAKGVLTNHACNQSCSEEFCNIPCHHLYGTVCIKLVASLHDSHSTSPVATWGNKPHLQCPFNWVQAILQTATIHGANPDKPLPINTAYLCWQLARQEQLASILSMLAGVLGKPSLPSAFMTALAQLGKQSAAATLSDLAQVRCRCVSEAASLSPAMTSVTIAAAVVVVIVGVVVAGVVIVVKFPNSCSIQTSKGSAIKASDKTRPCTEKLCLSSDSETLCLLCNICCSKSMWCRRTVFPCGGFFSVYGKCQPKNVQYTGAWGCFAIPGFAGRQRLGGVQGQPQ
jgi:hypothetical protein